MSLGFTSYSIKNDQAFYAALQRARDVVEDLKAPFNLIANDFYRSQKAIWQLTSPGQYPGLGGFNPKARVSKNGRTREMDAQIKKFRRYGFIYPLLKASGALEKAASIREGYGNITSIGKQNMEMGVDEGLIEYADFHQSGTKKMPMRKFLFIGPEAKKFATSDQQGRLERWLNILNDQVLQSLGITGFAERGIEKKMKKQVIV